MEDVVRGLNLRSVACSDLQCTNLIIRSRDCKRPKLSADGACPQPTCYDSVGDPALNSCYNLHNRVASEKKRPQSSGIRIVVVDERQQPPAIPDALQQQALLRVGRIGCCPFFPNLEGLVLLLLIRAHIGKRRRKYLPSEERLFLDDRCLSYFLPREDAPRHRIPRFARCTGA